MGRRKDRMLAAMHNAGRRVKLDLFAEPSGDLGVSSVDEVGKDTEPKELADLPKSPSSSDQPQQNPLLLLGQYSDDDVEEESNERVGQAVVDNPCADDKNQVKEPSGEQSENPQVNTAEDLGVPEVKQQEKDEYVVTSETLQKPEIYDTKEIDATASGHEENEMKLGEQTSVTGTSDVHLIGDVSLGWRMVLHEESNRYYYWNVETGETSWEVPPALAQTTGLTLDQGTTFPEDTLTAAVLGTNESDSTQNVQSEFHSTAAIVDASLGANIISQGTNFDKHEFQMDERAEEIKSDLWKGENAAPDVCQVESRNIAGDALNANGSLPETAPAMLVHVSSTDEENKSAFDLSSALVRRSEHLLEKLKSLQGSKGLLHGHDQMSKYVLEIEIRLSDFKSLLSHGLSLLPFWMHSERQLKRLEAAIDEEIYQLAKSQVDEVMGMDISSPRGEDKSPETGNETEADENQNPTSVSNSDFVEYAASGIETISMVEKDLQHEASIGVIDHGVNSVASPATHLQSEEQVNGSVSLHESITNPSCYAGEDVDMDVDMEVEDTVPLENTSIRETSGTKDFAQPEQLIQHTPQFEDVLFVPPPPDDEWIPPPPPDTEQIPPPPPDEPPDSSYTSTTSSYMEAAQPLSYPEQYNLSYPTSSYTYYGPMATEVPGSNIFGHADGSQVHASPASIYYGAMPNSYNETASAMVNPVASAAYYGVQEGTTAVIPVTSSVEPSVNYCESGPPGGNIHTSDGSGSVNAHSELGATVYVDVPVVGADLTALEVATTSATIQAPPTISVKENASDISTNAAASTAANSTTSTAKVQSKALRNKKRTAAAAPSLTLRSNKKVSSLVDKWKAAKEELKEDEENEPQSAIEILERKRQREIEEWRAQQIASGEAKENANFQPLGGDWREKVKRRRAEAAKEAAKQAAEAQTDEKQPPSLVELSRDLPSGWQAYWDESSKQVYYGNLITSETTWTRPTK